MVVGCSATKSASGDLRDCANDITDGILIGLNNDDYGKFSENFDQKMKSSLPEVQFKVISYNIKSKIGNYLSKEYVGSENKDGYTVMIYKGKFSQENDDVIIRTVLSENAGKMLVSGFWLDSPNLRK
jgi:hypothetical protein